MRCSDAPIRTSADSGWASRGPGSLDRSPPQSLHTLGKPLGKPLGHPGSYSKKDLMEGSRGSLMAYGNALLPWGTRYWRTGVFAYV